VIDKDTSHTKIWNVKRSFLFIVQIYNFHAFCSHNVRYANVIAKRTCLKLLKP